MNEMEMDSIAEEASELVGLIDDLLGSQSSSDPTLNGYYQTADFVVSKVTPLVNKLTSGGYDSGLISVGQDLLNRANEISGWSIDSYGAIVDPNLPGQDQVQGAARAALFDDFVSHLSADTIGWVGQANKALSGPPPSQQQGQGPMPSGVSSDAAAIADAATAWISQARAALAQGPGGVSLPAAAAAAAASAAGVAISGFTPSGGGLGTSVTLSGSGFTGATQVMFSGAPAPVNVISDTQATAQVPQGASMGPISIATPKGTATSAQAFMVQADGQTMPGGGGGGGFGGGGGGGDDGGGGGGDDGGGDDQGQGQGQDDGQGSGYDGYAADDGGGDASDPTQDPNNVMYADGGDGSDDGSDGSDDGSSDVGHGHGGGGHHGGGRRGGWGLYGGPWYELDGFDGYGAREPFDEVSVDDVVDAIAARMKTRDAGVHVGAYDIQSAQRQMNTLKQVTVGIGKAMVKHAMSTDDAMLTIAKSNGLPLINTLSQTRGHLQWHADKLDGLKDDKAIYDSGDDLKKWVMQVWIDSNAIDEGLATREEAWEAMWTEIGEQLASMPAKIANAVMSIPGKLVEGITGIPIWGWVLGGVTLVVMLGYGVYKLASKHGGIVVHAASRKYLP